MARKGLSDSNINELLYETDDDLDAEYESSTDDSEEDHVIVPSDYEFDDDDVEIPDDNFPVDDIN